MPRGRNRPVLVIRSSRARSLAARIVSHLAGNKIPAGDFRNRTVGAGGHIDDRSSILIPVLSTSRPPPPSPACRQPSSLPRAKSSWQEAIWSWIARTQHWCLGSVHASTFSLRSSIPRLASNSRRLSCKVRSSAMQPGIMGII